MTTRNILSGFQHTGSFPYNREHFTEADFSPATLTDRDIPDVNPMQLMADIPDELEANTSTTSIEVPQVATGTCVAQSSYHTSDKVVGPPEVVYVSPGEIHSVPKAGPRKTKRWRKKGNTKNLTSTPVRNEIGLEKKRKKRKLSAPNVKKGLFQKNHESDSRGFLRRTCN